MLRASLGEEAGSSGNSRLRLGARAVKGWVQVSKVGPRLGQAESDPEEEDTSPVGAGKDGK